MEAEVEQRTGAAWHERTEGRKDYRNGELPRRWDTRLGTLHLEIPKLRNGGYVPGFLEHRKGSERALIGVIQESVIGGVLTRKVERSWSNWISAIGPRIPRDPHNRMAMSLSFVMPTIW